jgi:hypothetical protein
VRRIFEKEAMKASVAVTARLRQCSAPFELVRRVQSLLGSKSVMTVLGTAGGGRNTTKSVDSKTSLRLS